MKILTMKRIEQKSEVGRMRRIYQTGNENKLTAVYEQSCYDIL